MHENVTPRYRRINLKNPSPTGGIAGLVICLFAKLNEWRFPQDTENREGVEHKEKMSS